MKAICVTLAGGALMALCLPALAIGTAPAPATVRQPARQTNEPLPTGLRPALYSALAKDAGPAYAIGKDGCATLPKQALTACFDKSGAHFSGPNAKPFGLHLVAWGRKGKMITPSPVAPKFKGNRVSYVRGPLTVWWRVLPMGFEQGFTLAKRPAGQGGLIFRLSSNARLTGNGGQSTLTHGKLRYGQLVVTDAAGKTIPATLKSNGDYIQIIVNDAQATYPLTVDPLVWLEHKVTASDGAAEDQFGFAVAVAVSGSTALIGAPGVTVNGNSEQGAAYLFTDSAGVWTQTQKLTASDGAAGDDFGGAIALDGTIALVGAAKASVNGNYHQGAAYVFTDSGGSWSQTQKLTSSDGAAFDTFGHAVALAGNTALVAAQQAAVNGNAQQGAVYVFSSFNGLWTQTQKIFANDGAAYDYFGSSIALSGATALIGVPDATVDGHYAQGAAYLFTQADGTWTQAQKLVAGDGAAFDSFGYSVALAGQTALLGAPYATVNGNSQEGAAYLFAASGGNWLQKQKLAPPDGTATMAFGQSLALNGTTALISAPWATVNGNAYQGEAYVFAESNGSWNEMQKLAASDGAAGDSFGGSTSSVALTDGTALVGVWIASVNGNTYQGATYFYGKGNLGFAMSAPQTVGQGQEYSSQTIATNNSSVASPAVSATITVPAATSFISATASQGICSETSGVVTCDFGQIDGNAATATADVTLKATGSVGTMIENTASIAKATPALTASAATTIGESGACPAGYTEFSGHLDAGQSFTSDPITVTEAGQKYADLTSPASFAFFAITDTRYGQHTYVYPHVKHGHRWGAAGTYHVGVQADATGGDYTLCVNLNPAQ